MRVTAARKATTRRQLLRAAAEVLRTEGWSKATTRAIAARAGVAAGTLFNYFPTKEAVAAALLEQAMEEAARPHLSPGRARLTAEDDLFALVWACLRSLRPYRAFVAPAVEAVLTPFAVSGAHEGFAARERHLQAVQHILAGGGAPAALTPTASHLYWALFCGALAHWAVDRSPHQEDSKALVDRWVRLFVASLKETGGSPC